MSKRLATTMILAVAATLAVVVPATPSAAVPPSNPNLQLGCGLEVDQCIGGGYAGTYHEGDTVRLWWWIKNKGSSAVTVTPSVGASGCAQTAYPYPGSIWIGPGDTRWFSTYVYGWCIGEGTGAVNAYPAHAEQDIDFICDVYAMPNAKPYGLTA